METSTISTEQGSWQPIIGGVLAERCSSIIQVIAERIAGQATQWMERAKYVSPVHYWLSQGFGGFALLFSYLSAAGFGGESAQRADDFEEKALDGLAREIMPCNLYDGVAGIAWMAAHRRGFLSRDTVCEDDFEEVNSRTVDLLARPRWPADYDLMLGLAGIGVYFLESPQWTASRRALSEIVRHLFETAERTGELVTWLTPPDRLVPHQRKAAPTGFYNLGIAHGVPGVISFLSAARDLVDDGRAEDLLEGAVRWVLSQEQSSGALRFPTWVTPDGVAVQSRLGWCYGDLGVACALLRAAESTGNLEWRKRGIAAAERCLEHLAVADFDDVCLCHGLSGIGHSLNRIHQATGDDRFRQGAISAFTGVCELWDPDGATWSGFPIAKHYGRDIPSLLEGTAGVALALLAATTTQTPGWDRMFFMDLPVMLR